MGTNNFYNHSNGIFVVESTSLEEAYESMKMRALDEGEEIEDFETYYEENAQSLYNEAGFLDEMNVEDYFEMMKYNLPKGIEMDIDSTFEATVTNKQGKMVAFLTLQSGYYDHMQIIVETDPEELYGDYYPETQAELFEMYTPHHQRLLNFLTEYTTAIRKVGGFSNGEAVYEMAN